jgi:ElaB/YqjD/DUF883 family membrane-anchored ribosome-binding protein
MQERSMDTGRRSQVDEVTERARHYSRQARRFVHDRPLQAVALSIGLGFVVGKILAGRNY